MSDEPNDKTLDENLSRLLRNGAELPRLSPQRRAQVLEALKAKQAEIRQAKERAMKTATPLRRRIAWLLAAAAAVAVAAWVLFGPHRPRVGPPDGPFPVQVGQQAGTGHVLKKILDDGSIVIARPGTQFSFDGPRKLLLETGDLYVIVARAQAPFLVETPHGKATARGTRFLVASTAETRVAVAQGTVRLSNDEGEVEVNAGQEGILPSDERPRRQPAPRISYLVSWAREALAQRERLVAKKKRDTGELIAVDPSGQEVRLTLRNYHVDVHIEDGIARTTVDQTFFNHVPRQIEGTFYFPLPPDASVSRLAMYVSGRLMEGGMVERSRGQQIYTHIKLQRRDPALLEMMEGNVFKMRIFPIEGRQEKRIFISYTQKLSELYGTQRYWFPMDHTHSNARQLSIRVRVKDAAGIYSPHSSTHNLASKKDGRDIVLNYKAKDVKPDQDLLLHLVPSELAGRASFATVKKEAFNYVFARVTPRLPGEVTPRPRQWIVLNDVSASRSKLDVRAQAYILERLIDEADDPDTITLINLDTKAHVQEPQFVSVRGRAARKLVAAARVALPLGATNLAAGLEAAAALIKQHRAGSPHILYLGDGVATDGRTSIDELLRRLPEGSTFVGVGVGKKADSRLLQAAADQTGGMFSLINPDEDIDWRVFDLVAALNTPRLVSLTAQFEAASGRPADIIAYPSARALADGETLFVVGRTQGDLPASLVLRGTVGSEPFARRYDLDCARTDGEFIPRLWAKRHIDELLKSGPEHRGEVVRLSKHYYVMTPYTSLIVLENEKMYKEFKVERGRKDHWALYPAPKTIKVVKEPVDWSRWSWWGWRSEDEKIKAKARPKSVKDMVESVQFRINAPFYLWPPRRDGQGRFALYNLLDSKANPTRLLTALLNLAARTEAGLAAKPESGGPSRTPQAWLTGPPRAGGTLSSFDTTDEFLPPVLGRAYNGLLWIRGQALGTPLRLDRLVTVWEINGDVDYLGFAYFDVISGGSLERAHQILGQDADFIDPWLRVPLGLEHYRTSRHVMAGHTARLSEVAGFMPWERRLTLYGDLYREGKYLTPSLARFTSGGDFAGGRWLSLAPEARHGLGTALRERYERIERDIRRFNARHGWSWGREGYPWDQGSIHLTGTTGALPGMGFSWWRSEIRPSPVNIGAAPTEVLRAVLRNIILASYDRALKTVPGTTAALAADFLVARRDELLAKKLSEKENKELEQINSALENVESAYPRFEDPGIFWGWQGWNYRPQPWTFQPPRIQAYPHYNWSFDLTRYAGGLYSTSFDVLDLVAQAHPTPPAGKVSDEAARAIASARKAIQPVRLRFGKEGPAILVGSGDRFALVHKTNMYLEERMVCDGENVYHLYPELGLAARRRATALRRAALRQLAPHLVEPADWLARSYDVELVEREADRFVLKLTPIMRVAQPPSADEARGRPKKAQAGAPVPHGQPAPKPPFHILVTVSPDGRILEKTLLVKDKATLRLTYTYDGSKVTARWFDAKGKEVGSVEFEAQPFTPAPDTFRADLEPYVVFDMPIRRPSYYQAQIKDAGQRRPAYKGDETTRIVQLWRHLALAYIQELNWRRWGGSNGRAFNAVGQALNTLERAKRKGKLGDLTLIGSCGYHHEVAKRRGKTDAPDNHALIDYYRRLRTRQWKQLASLRDRCPGTLLGHLAAFYAALSDPSRLEALKTLIKQYERSPLLLAAASFVGNSGNKAEPWFELFEHPRWRALAIMMAANRTKTDAQRKRIAEAFARLHRELSEKGYEVPVPPQMASILKGTDGGKHWQSVVRSALKVAMDEDRVGPILRFAELALRNGEQDLADVALSRAKKLARDDGSLLTRLALAQTYWAGGRPKDALRLYNELFAALKTKDVPASAGLLAATARLAQQAGDPGRAIELEERALGIEHQHLPELVNLQAFRRRYQWLWRQYQSRIQAAANAKDEKAVADWLARAERAWTRWYEVDRENPSMVQQMATLQMTARREDAAWLYLSSLIDAKPRDAESYYSVGRWHLGRNERDRAQQWYARAYEWDTANPRWLFERAGILRDLGRKDDARRLYRQIIDGKWAPGLQRYVARAKKEIKK